MFFAVPDQKNTHTLTAGGSVSLLRAAHSRAPEKKSNPGGVYSEFSFDPTTWHDIVSRLFKQKFLHIYICNS